MIFIACQRVTSTYFRPKLKMVARLRGHDRFFLSCTEIFYNKVLFITGVLGYVEITL
ncbi:Uncharacterised protein [Legionella londiniensis]|uniref:Uncharacterized protein n=1 Tax=Legionella londiniensis TaxID=45068 RepID=A0A0W0VLR3_9GAMM|nr:hypothetical protein Llon_1145 [Legionella londiniensis]STX93678.1 Uncharacterised protein [Legionella londiniensis]